MLDIINHASPNHEARREGVRPSLVVLHYTGMKDGPAALARLCDAQAKVSAHYLVEEDGRVFALVDETRRAWHAGVSYWRGETDINSHSIGIEIVNPGHEFGYRPFPKSQMQAVLELCHNLQARYGLPPQAFLGHSDIAPLRKQDPGELFDWPWLARQGIGLWPEAGAPLPVTAMPALLEKIGYQPAKDAVEQQAVISAFQRHYYPQHISGLFDTETAARITALARMMAVA